MRYFILIRWRGLQHESLGDSLFEAGRDDALAGSTGST